MLRAERTFHLPELSAFYRSVELRAVGLRVGVFQHQTLMSDFALLHYAAPFAHRLTRSCVVIVLEGEARFEEKGKRVYVESSELCFTDQNRAGTEAYAPMTRSTLDRALALFVDWDPKMFGGSFETFDSGRLSQRDRARLHSCALNVASEETSSSVASEETSARASDGRTSGASSERALRAVVEMLAILRSVGLPIADASLSYLKSQAPETDEQAVMNAMMRQFSNLEGHPSFGEIADDLGWSERHTNRRIAKLLTKHEIPWPQWRAMLHSARMINVFRVLSTPGATTELAAKKAGFRSPAALCHALSKANLPSPGTLAKACQQNRLGAWTSIVDRRPLSPAA